MLEEDQKYSELFFPNSQKKFKELLASVAGKKIAVVGHMRPDGDCVSSQVAAAKLFRDAGALEVICINKDDFPYLYREFADGEKIYDAENAKKEIADPSSYEIVTVDCADYARVSPTFAQNFPKPLACIDHHVSNVAYGKISIVENTASANAELIAGMMFDAGMKIEPKLANVLYMGLMTDTRQLTTSNTNLRSFKIATKLVECGADPAEVSILLYQREKFARMKLLSQFLNSLTMHFDNKLCIGILPLGIYEQTGALKEDTDGLVDYARNIEGVEIAALLEVLPDSVKGSLRSKRPETHVNEIAGIFGGGGHFAAAGFTAKMSIDEFMPKFLKAVSEHLKK